MSFSFLCLWFNQIKNGNGVFTLLIYSPACLNLFLPFCFFFRFSDIRLDDDSGIPTQEFLDSCYAIVPVLGRPWTLNSSSWFHLATLYLFLLEPHVASFFSSTSFCVLSVSIISCPRRWCMSFLSAGPWLRGKLSVLSLSSSVLFCLFHPSCYFMISSITRRPCFFVLSKAYDKTTHTLPTGTLGVRF